MFVPKLAVVCCYIQTRYLEVLNSHSHLKCLGFESRSYVSGILQENLGDFFFEALQAVKALQSVNLKPA